MVLNDQEYQKKDKWVSWVEVDLKAVEYNLHELQRLASRNQFVLPSRPKTLTHHRAMELLTIIKADAYGHGMKEIGRLLQKKGVSFFGVSDVKEGMGLRQAGITKPILLLESTLPYFAKDIVDHDLMPTVCTEEMAQALDRYAKKKSKQVYIHIEVDTGMGRLGIGYEDVFDFVKKIDRLRNLVIHGLFTHFPVADTDPAFTRKQIKVLSDLVMRLDKEGLVVPYVHAGNSMGLAGYQTRVLNLARPGLMLYGMYPSPRLRKRVSLRPVLTVKSKVLLVKKIKKGCGISYGKTFVAPQDMTVAVLPIGYNDGYFRSFSNKGFVIIQGVKCPVVGNVTMDQIIVDVSRIKDVSVGMVVTVLGKEKNVSVTADDLACHAQTINYEITCSLGNRLPRKFIK